MKQDSGVVVSQESANCKWNEKWCVEGSKLTGAIADFCQVLISHCRVHLQSSSAAREDGSRRQVLICKVADYLLSKVLYARI